ncbi:MULTISPECIES: DMT family transporter [Agrobacterium]|uniref:DMT family transporter n=1 Tax=Agrobacterium salinitolerans TaxID=1183413 RepID=A0A9X3KPV4_9HYPH|nr:MULTISPECIES: DMT family transporter [Agrobacterium]MBA4775154.1 DMT family transporter [Hyphomicrobiales bacterium]MCZ7850926.1 DMT family transporter [Agrobacterium salinitolerans]MCZ7856618.1 DMT family transporter [Agrobacterium salinitolerans]MCZ7863330.1 DMT family transporter [Agrobacterium salinitolerans]MCZ7888483.1 DMT family transporter [Agrobacterium salinitolerans]
MSILRKLSPTGLGVAVMLLGMLLFALNDAMGKWLVATYSQGQVILIRSAAALIILVPIVWRAGLSGLVRIERPGLQFARVFFSTAELFCFYFAVAALPLADVMTYWLAAPIYVAALSPFLLGEKVGWRRWTAIAIGFVGVLIALKPSSASLTSAALFSILGSAAFAFMMLSGRQLRNTPDTVLAFWQIIGAALAGIVAVFLTPSGWLPVQSGFDLAFLGLLGVVAMTAHVLVNRALKLADAATVAPLQYTLLLWAVIFGWLFFNDVPQTSIVVGAGLIVLSGLYIFFRENTLKRRRETAEGLAAEQV